jgi:hypothetical protein
MQPPDTCSRSLDRRFSASTAGRHALARGVDAEAELRVRLPLRCRQPEETHDLDMVLRHAPAHRLEAGEVALCFC